MKLFEARCETDPNLVGTNPQVYFYTIEGYERPYDNIWHKRTDPTQTFRMNGILKLDAFRTAVLSCTELSPGRGLLLENTVLERLDNLVPKNCLRHPFEVEDPANNSVYSDYTYLEVGMTEELLPFIDFARSSFRKSYFGDFHSEVTISSWADWKTKQQEENENSSSLMIQPTVLFLPEEAIRSIGVIKFPFSSAIYITESASRIIEDDKTTGVKLIESRTVNINIY